MPGMRTENVSHNHQVSSTRSGKCIIQTDKPSVCVPKEIPVGYANIYNFLISATA